MGSPPATFEHDSRTPPPAALVSGIPNPPFEFPHGPVFGPEALFEPEPQSRRQTRWVPAEGQSPIPQSEIKRPSFNDIYISTPQMHNESPRFGKKSANSSPHSQINALFWGLFPGHHKSATNWPKPFAAPRRSAKQNADRIHHGYLQATLPVLRAGISCQNRLSGKWRKFLQNRKDGVIGMDRRGGARAATRRSVGGFLSVQSPALMEPANPTIGGTGLSSSVSSRGVPARPLLMRRS